MNEQTVAERRARTIARWPDRRAHDFWSPWPTASMTKCERCGAYLKDHAPDPSGTAYVETTDALGMPIQQRFSVPEGATLWIVETEDRHEAYRTLRSGLVDDGLTLCRSWYYDVIPGRTVIVGYTDEQREETES